MAIRKQCSTTAITAWFEVTWLSKSHYRLVDKSVPTNAIERFWLELVNIDALAEKWNLGRVSWNFGTSWINKAFLQCSTCNITFGCEERHKPSQRLRFNKLSLSFQSTLLPSSVNGAFCCQLKETRYCLEIKFSNFKFFRRNIPERSGKTVAEWSYRYIGLSDSLKMFSPSRVRSTRKGWVLATFG